MLDTQIAIGTAIPGSAPVAPAQQTPSFLQATRKMAVGHGVVRLRPTSVIALPNIPSMAQSAILVLEAAPSADKSTALGRFWSDGTWPNEVEGLPMYHGSVIEISSQEDLQRTRIFTTDARNHKINVQYFTGL